MAPARSILLVCGRSKLAISSPWRPYARPKTRQGQALTRRYRDAEEAPRRAALTRKTSASVAEWRPAARNLDEIDDDPSDEALAAAPGWGWVEMPAPAAPAQPPAVIYAAAAPAPRKKPMREEAKHPARKRADASTYQFGSDDDDDPVTATTPAATKALAKTPAHGARLPSSFDL